MTKRARGFLIVLEGVDGSGKSTLARSLSQELEGSGFRVVLTREPTDGKYGRQIRELANRGRNTVSPEEEYALFLEDRREHVASVVVPALERGEVVVQDRSYFSTVAYQSQRGIDASRIVAENETFAPRPDLLIVVDVPASVALERIRRNRGLGADDFETLANLERVRQVMLSFDAFLVDGTAHPEEVLGRVKHRVDEALHSWRCRTGRGEPF